MTLITLLVVAVLFMGITVTVYKMFWDYQLTVQVEFLQKEIEEGQSLTIKEIVENRKILPLPTLLVKFETERSIQWIKEKNCMKNLYLFLEVEMYTFNLQLGYILNIQQSCIN